MSNTPHNKPTLRDLGAWENLNGITLTVNQNIEFGPVVWIHDRETQQPLLIAAPSDLESQLSAATSKRAFAEAAQGMLRFLGYKSTTLDEFANRMGRSVRNYEKLVTLANARR